MDEQKVWIITGASQGLGLATVKHLLSKGQQVIATTREPGAFYKKNRAASSAAGSNRAGPDQ